MKTRRILLVLLAIASGAFCTQGVSAQTTAKTATAKQVKTAKEATANIIQLSDTLSGSNIFRQIVAKYKGQPVLVDFWATWCGPCRMAMKTIQPLKDELWGKCAFVYVTSPSSPQATWSKMVPDIHGDHFYVNEKQWTTLMKQFQVQGIPAYIVVDSKGKVQQKHIGFPGEDVLREELNKAKGK